MNEPEEQTLPGMPPPDRRRELRAALETAESDARKARREMIAAALDLAECSAAHLRTRNDVPAGVFPAATAYLQFRTEMFKAQQDAGNLAAKLRLETARVEHGLDEN